MTGDAAAPAAGLVPCATTGRPCEEIDRRESFADLVDQAWSPAFPDAQLVDVAASLLPGIGCPVGELPEGPHWRIQVGPGVVGVGTKDYARAERTAEREIARRALDVDMAVAWFESEGEWPPEAAPSRKIEKWSRKSRARMVRRLCELDYTPLYVDADGRRHGRIPALSTLTYPGEWEVVAPDGPTVKAHLKAFRKRYERAWGEPLVGVWKQEFQRRGAPHIHLLHAPPHGRDRVTNLPFREWLSRAWAEIVDHPDPEQKARHLRAGTGVDFAEGLRAKDPKRVAVYFLKHNVAGDKEYQHDVPELWQEPGKGPGRFWGYWGLKPVVATVEVEPDDAVAAARVMRRWSRAQDRRQQVVRPRVAGGRAQSVYPEVIGLAGAQFLANQGRTRYRRTRRRVVLVSKGRGWVAVNDGPAFASDLARYLDQRHQDFDDPLIPPPTPPPPPAGAPRLGSEDAAMVRERDRPSWWVTTPGLAGYQRPPVTVVGRVGSTEADRE